MAVAVDVLQLAVKRVLLILRPVVVYYMEVVDAVKNQTVKRGPMASLIGV
jgi:hypothetical protein